MNKTTTIVAVAFAIIAGTACNSTKTENPQASPRSVAETIFNAAKNGSYDGLPALIDTDADSDSKMIAQAATDKKVQEEFKTYFKNGKVVGEPVINDDKASVNILFGPEGEKEETFEMVKRDGKWYLQSF